MIINLFLKTLQVNFVYKVFPKVGIDNAEIIIIYINFELIISKKDIKNF